MHCSSVSTLNQTPWMHIHGAMMSVDIRSTVEACSHLATKNHKYYVVNFPVRLWKLARWVHICSPLTSTSCSIAHWMCLLWYEEAIPPLTSYLSWISVKYFICVCFCLPVYSLNQLITGNKGLVEYKVCVCLCVYVCVFSVGRIFLWTISQWLTLTLIVAVHLNTVRRSQLVYVIFPWLLYPPLVSVTILWFLEKVYFEYLTPTLLTPVIGEKSQLMLLF